MLYSVRNSAELEILKGINNDNSNYCCDVRHKFPQTLLFPVTLSVSRSIS